MLCKVCQTFDISALFSRCLAREAQEKPAIAGYYIFPLYPAIPKFFAHHHGLVKLHGSARDGCTLCSLIWAEFSRNVPVDALQPQWLDDDCGRGHEQIYLGVTTWAPGSHLPYLTAKQFLPRDAERSLGTFEVCAVPGRVPRGYEHLLARTVPESAAGDEAFATAAGWMETCLTQHERCEKMYGQSRELPKRVLCVGREGETVVRLSMTEGKHGEWAALSYCWGPKSDFVLKRSNMQQWLRDGKPLESFPATLRDAVVVARHLGIEHLWIDALCIIQDDAEDWATQSGVMMNIYSHAKVTISAADSSSSSQGFLCPRKSGYQQSQMEWCQRDGASGASGASAVFLRSITSFWDSYMRSCPLNARGWTLQESLLAPRTLSYGRQQMAWECLERRVDESERPFAPGEKYREKDFVQELLSRSLNSRPGFLHLFGLSKFEYLWRWREREAGYDRWFAIVKEYSTRSLTVAADVLPALSGLAFAFGRALNDEYCAGLWARDVLRGLMWTRSPPLIQAHVSQDTSALAHKVAGPKGYCVPSWSWASIPGRTILFHYPLSNGKWQVEEEAKVLRVHTEPLSTNPFGHTSSGYIDIEASFLDIHDPRRVEGGSVPGASLLEHSVASWTAINPNYQYSEFGLQHHGHASQSFGVILLSRFYAEEYAVTQSRKRLIKNSQVVLLVVESTGAQENEYRRVGLFLHGSQPMNPDDVTGMETFKEMEQQKWKKRVIRLV